MNVYEKLNAARDIFHSREIKKTGRNDYAGYDYFELGDFVVPALEIFKQCGLAGLVSFGREMATLKVVNLEKPDDVIVFESPMSEANLKGCHPVQNLGAVQTYIRRYLWVAALEIVEHDALNGTQGKGMVKPTKASPVPDVELPADRKAHVDAIVADMVAAFDEGNELAAVEAWYSVDSFADNDERTYAWKALAPYSKIRSTIKANKR